MSKKGDYKKHNIGNHELSPETLMMSYGYEPHLSEGSVKPPVFLTSTFVFNNCEEGEEFFNITAGRQEPSKEHPGGLIYSRFNHPNVEIIEDRLALWERAEKCVAFSSGMGAISSVLLSYLRPDDVVVQSSPLYGGTETLIRKFLPEFNIATHDLTDMLDKDTMKKDLKAACEKGRVAMIFVETPANPTNMLLDFEALVEVVDEIEQETGHRPVTVCDNTLMGPLFQQVIPHGLDLSVYSLTKYVGGHSDLVAGAVCGSAKAIKPVRAARGALGLNLDPHTSWMISRSLETVTLRMERGAQTGRKVAQWIADNPYVKAEVLHPDFITDEAYQEVYKRQCSGPGSTFSFVVDAPKKTMFKLLDNLSIIKLAVSLGGNESLTCHPASTTHSGVPLEVREKVNVTDGLVRLSIGLETPEDLIADLDNAFQAAFGTAEKMAVNG